MTEVCTQVKEDPGSGENATKAAGMCRNLAIFDGISVATAVLAPRLMMKVLARGGPPEDAPLLRRAGVVWLAMAAVQARAMLMPDDPAALKAVAVVRLMEVPSLLLLLRSRSRILGKLVLWSAPVLNVAVARVLWKWAREMERSGAVA